MTEKCMVLLHRFNEDAEALGIPAHPAVSVVPEALTPKDVVVLAWLARIEDKLDQLLGVICRPT